MAVAFDAKFTSMSEPSPASPLDSTLLTVGSGTQRVAVFMIVYAASSSLTSGMTVTWDQGGTNQACTLADELTFIDTFNIFMQFWYVVAPTSGNKTLRVTNLNSAVIVRIDGISVTGADQTTPLINAASNSGTSTTASVSVTSATGDMVLGQHWNVNGLITGVNNTVINIGSSNIVADNRANGSASVSMTATLSSSDSWHSHGIDIAQAAAASQVYGGAFFLDPAPNFDTYRKRRRNVAQGQFGLGWTPARASVPSFAQIPQPVRVSNPVGDNQTIGWMPQAPATTPSAFGYSPSPILAALPTPIQVKNSYGPFVFVPPPGTVTPSAFGYSPSPNILVKPEPMAVKDTYAPFVFLPPPAAITPTQFWFTPSDLPRQFRPFVPLEQAQLAIPSISAFYVFSDQSYVQQVRPLSAYQASFVNYPTITGTTPSALAFSESPILRYRAYYTGHTYNFVSATAQFFPPAPKNVFFPSVNPKPAARLPAWLHQFSSMGSLQPYPFVSVNYLKNAVIRNRLEFKNAVIRIRLLP